MASPVYGCDDPEEDLTHFRRRLPSYMKNSHVDTARAPIDAEVKFLVHKIKDSWDDLQEFTDEDNSTEMAKTIDLVICVMVAYVCQGVHHEENIYSSLVSELEWLFDNVSREPRYKVLHMNVFMLDCSLARLFEETD
jgi:hypothetical protein